MMDTTTAGIDVQARMVAALPSDDPDLGRPVQVVEHRPEPVEHVDARPALHEDQLVVRGRDQDQA